MRVDLGGGGLGSVGKVLVIGASGVLSSLVAAALQRGIEVVAVTRTFARLSKGEGGGGKLRVVVADAKTSVGITAIVAAGPFDAAVIYGPAIDHSLVNELAQVVRGRVVLLVTSALASPFQIPLEEMIELARPRPNDTVVLLGWTGPRGYARWHSSEEICAAAGDSLANGEDCVLGRVRPWDERPRR